MSACPPVLDMALLIELLPQYASGHVYRLNSVGAGKRRLPPYDLNVGAGLWSLETILEWANRFAIVLDPVALERIEKEQELSDLNG